MGFLEGALAFILANQSWLVGVGTFILGLFGLSLTPKRVKSGFGIKAGRAVSSFGRNKLGKAVYEKIETVFQGLFGDFVEGFNIGLDEDDKV